MKFKVFRTSLHQQYEKPCQEAKKETITWDSNEMGVLNLETNEIVPLVSTETVDVWTIDFETLDQVQSFVKKYGNIIFLQKTEYGLSQLEIYDDYRE